MKYFPDRVSHNDLLRAMALRIVGREQRETDYALELMNSLEALSRRAQLEVLVQEETGLPAEVIQSKSVPEMIALLEDFHGDNLAA